MGVSDYNQGLAYNTQNSNLGEKQGVAEILSEILKYNHIPMLGEGADYTFGLLQHRSWYNAWYRNSVGE